MTLCPCIQLKAADQMLRQTTLQFLHDANKNKQDPHRVNIIAVTKKYQDHAHLRASL